MIIDALKARPDDFFGPISGRTLQVYDSPRFHSIERRMDRDFTPRRDSEEIVRTDESVEFWFLTPEERDALRAAYTEAKRERFTAEVIYNMMRPNDEKEDELLKYKASGRYGQSIAGSMVATKNAVAASVLSGFTDARGIFNQAPMKLEGTALNLVQPWESGK